MNESSQPFQIVAASVVIAIALALLEFGVYLSLEIYEIVVDILYTPEKGPSSPKFCME